MIKNDFPMQQIKELIQFLLGLAYPMGFDDEDKNRTQSSMISQKLYSLAAEGKYGEAEDALFDAFDEDDADLATGILFYESLLRIDEKELRRGDFSLKEVETGLRDYARLFHVDL